MNNLLKKHHPKTRMVGKLNRNIDKLNQKLEEKNLEEIFYILGSRREIFRRNFWAGVGRGVGIGIGVTIITAVLIIVLKKIVALNIPIIGRYIADIIDIVENSRY